MELPQAAPSVIGSSSNGQTLERVASITSEERIAVLPASALIAPSIRAWRLIVAVLLLVATISIAAYVNMEPLLAQSEKHPLYALADGGGLSQGQGLYSKFGGGRRCSNSFVAMSFTLAEVERAEQRLFEWFLTLDERIESYVDHHRQSMFLNAYAEGLRAGGDRKHTFFRHILPREGPTCKMPLSWFGAPLEDNSKPYCRAPDSFVAGCNLFSLGSHDEWDTEVAMHNATPCHIHTFDCSSGDSMPSKIRDRTHFHKVCVGDHDFTDVHGRRFISWPSLLKMIPTMKPGSSPEYLKMDIEGFEYGVMRSILRSGDPSLLPKQIALEIHSATYLPESGNPAGQLSWARRNKGGGEILAFMLMFYELGYRLIFVNWQTVCLHCAEVLFARIYC